MEDLFKLLSGSARIDKSKRQKKRNRDEGLAGLQREEELLEQRRGDSTEERVEYHDDEDIIESGQSNIDRKKQKNEFSKEKLHQIHKEEIASFRRSMSIKVANKHDPDLPDPISSFYELSNYRPIWWNNNNKDDESNNDNYIGILRCIQRNIEAGKWKEPTPIQMQSIPSLLARRDFIGAAPTGSGKSGGFIIPALLLSSVSYEVFYGSDASTNHDNKPTSSKEKETNSTAHKTSRQGEIRALILAPSLELAAQLHREVERLGNGKPGGLSSLLLSKSNVAQVIAGNAGGKKGVDILVATPLRLVDSIGKGLKLNHVRLVVLDEADRLLDSSDGKKATPTKQKFNEKSSKKSSSSSDEDSDDDEIVDDAAKPSATSGSSQSQSFLSQMDVILSEIPSTALRALFSATITPMVRSLSESILRNPIDITIASSGTQGGANPDIEQELMFVGREEGKLLAIRQLSQRGQLHPPVIVFLESQERAQALFGELLYDGIRVDVIHAGRSKAAREQAVAKFRKGETWVLICTDLVARGVDFRAVNMVINYDLPASGVTYVHRIGRTGRAGRKGKAITLFTEADFDNLRTIANVMKQSGCDVQEWMLNRLPSSKHGSAAMNKKVHHRRQTIDTTPSYDKNKRHKKKQMIEHNLKKKAQDQSSSQKKIKK